MSLLIVLPVCYQNTEILDAILHCETVIFASRNWRLQEDFMMIFLTMPSCFSSEVVRLKIVPLVFRKLHAAVILYFCP